MIIWFVYFIILLRIRILLLIAMDDEIGISFNVFNINPYLS